MEWSIDLPEDMRALLEMIRSDQSDTTNSVEDLYIENYLDQVSDEIGEDIFDDDE